MGQSRSREVSVGVGLVAGCVWLVLTMAIHVSSTQASIASLTTVKGVPTLGLVTKENEANNVDLSLEPGGKTFTLKDSGQLPDFSYLVLKLDEASLPGCVTVPSVADPTDDYVRCEIAKVKRFVADLGPRDDTFDNGDSLLDRYQVPIRTFLNGGRGNDQLIGGRKSDMLVGGPGRDLIKGMKGNDAVSGGAGVDSLSGDDDYVLDKPPARGGNDRVFGGPGRDYIYPGSGRDLVVAGPGNDIVSSVLDRDRDVVNCGAGRKDSLLGVNSRGIRFAEKAVIGCETVSNGTFGGLVWSCRKRRCTVTVNPYSAIRSNQPGRGAGRP